MKKIVLLSGIFLITFSTKGAIGQCGNGDFGAEDEYVIDVDAIPPAVNGDEPPPYTPALIAVAAQPSRTQIVLGQPQQVVRTVPQPIPVPVTQGQQRAVFCGFECNGCECQDRGMPRPKQTSARFCDKECSCFDMRDTPSGPFSCCVCNKISQLLVCCLCCPSTETKQSKCLYDDACLLPIIASCFSCYWVTFDTNPTHLDECTCCRPTCCENREGNCALHCLDRFSRDFLKDMAPESTIRPTSTKATCCEGECSCFDLRRNPSGPCQSQRLNKISQSLVYLCCCPFDVTTHSYDSRIVKSGYVKFPLTAPFAWLCCLCLAGFEIE